MQKRPAKELHFTDEELNVLSKHFPEGVVAFDLEMTGLSPLFDKIIEIAAVKIMPNGEITSFHSLVNPLITIPEHTVQFHNITNEDVRDAPSIKKPLADFIKFYESLPLIAHNAMYDASFLIRAMHENNMAPGLSDIMDSCRFPRTIYKHKKPELRPDNFKLSTLAEYFKIDFSHHQALDDAYVSLKIFAQCLIHLGDITKGDLKQKSFLYKLNAFKKASDYFLPNKLKGIKDLVQKREPFLITYKGGSFKGQYRRVAPVSILPLPQGLVMYAECMETNIHKYFQVKKIQNFKEIE